MKTTGEKNEFGIRVNCKKQGCAHAHVFNLQTVKVKYNTISIFFIRNRSETTEIVCEHTFIGAFQVIKFLTNPINKGLAILLLLLPFNWVIDCLSFNKSELLPSLLVEKLTDHIHIHKKNSQNHSATTRRKNRNLSFENVFFSLESMSKRWFPLAFTHRLTTNC